MFVGIKRITEAWDVNTVNKLLLEGWILLHIYTRSEHSTSYTSNNTTATPPQYYGNGTSGNLPPPSQQITLNNPPSVNSFTAVVYVLGMNELGTTLFQQ